MVSNPAPQVTKRGDQDLGGAPEGLDALTVAERLRADGGVGAFVARDYARMGEFVQAFRFFANDIEVVEFPAWDCLPYDRLSPTSSVSAERRAALTRLAQREAGDRKPLLVVTTSSGRLSPASRWASRVRAAIRSADTDEVGLSRS